MVLEAFTLLLDAFCCCFSVTNSCLTLCDPIERLLLNHAKTPGFLASGGEEFNPGPEMRLDRSELLYNKVLLKYKGDKASDIGIRRGQKEYPPASLHLDVM